MEGFAQSCCVGFETRVQVNSHMSWPLSCTKGRLHHPQATRHFQISIMCKWMRPFWGTDCRRSPKSRASPLFAVPASRELESAGTMRFYEILSQYPQSAFQGFSGGCQGGQQQFATQTLRVSLLGIQDCDSDSIPYKST